MRDSNPIPSVPKVEPVPQEVRELVRRIQRPPWPASGFLISEVQAAALILAAMERFAEQKTANLVRELEQATQTIARAEKDRIEHSQQLAALQRENAQLKTQSDFVAGWRSLAKEIYETGKASGFYDHAHTDPSFNHSEKMMLVVCEIAEGVEGLRGAPFPGIADDKLPHRPMIEVELADAIIRIMNYASHCGLDVAGAVIEKNAFNKTRGHKHDGKRF